LSYVGYYEVTAASDPIGNAIGIMQINNDRPKPSSAKPIKHGNGNGPNPLVIGDDYGCGGGSVVPINNDNGVDTSAWPNLINNDNGGGATTIASSSCPKPNHVNNDNGVARSTPVWPTPKPITKVIGTSPWMKPINNDNVVAKGTSVWLNPKPINNANIFAKGTSVWPTPKPINNANIVAKGTLVWPKPMHDNHVGQIQSTMPMLLPSH
jgi:hypothetical protein